MFTGIIEEVGTLESLHDYGDAMCLTVRAPRVAGGAGHGDSISVNGCCLTVTDHDDTTFGVDVMKESLDRTSLGDLHVGHRVNLERAVRADGRLGGHIVQGHVDGTGTVTGRTPSEHWDVVRIAVPASLVRYVAPKGSIAVDGVSLTVVEVEDRRPSLTVSLIPTTLHETTLGEVGIGGRVNLEVDVLAKYVERLLP